MCIPQSGRCAIEPAQGKQGLIERTSHATRNLKGRKRHERSGDKRANFLAARNRGNVAPGIGSLHGGHS